MALIKSSNPFLPRATRIRHQNIKLPVIYMEDIRGGVRVVENLIEMYQLAGEVEGIDSSAVGFEEHVTIIYVKDYDGEGNPRRYELVDVTDITDGEFNETAFIPYGIGDAIPTLISELTNDTGFITNSVSDFTVSNNLGFFSAVGTTVTADEFVGAFTGTASGNQPLDSDLTAIAALTTTSFGRSLLTPADAAAARTILGVGTGSGDALTTNPLSQFAATTSAQLAGVISDETGSGSLVFSVSPTFTGAPLAPTASNGTNTTQVATTAFVAAGFQPTFSTQAAGTVFSGPLFGSSNASPAFRKIDKGDTPVTVNMGVLYDKSTWANLTDFTSRGGHTVSVVSNQLQFTGGSNVLTDSLDINYGTLLPQYNLSGKFTPCKILFLKAQT